MELADAGSPVLPGPIRAELLDHELAERIVQISRIPRAALRLTFRGQPVEIGVLHEESRRVLPRPSRRMHHDRRYVPAVAQKGVLQLSELQPQVPESLLDHHLLAVVRPALRERVREVTLEDRIANAVLVEQMHAVSGVAFVDGDVPEHRVIQVAQPFLPLLRRPSFLGGGHIVEALPSDLLEAPGRIQRRGREAEEWWGLDDLGPLLRWDCDDVMGDDVLSDLL